MTVQELGDRISMYELEEWAGLARVENDERDNAQRVARVEAQARANRKRSY